MTDNKKGKNAWGLGKTLTILGLASYFVSVIARDPVLPPRHYFNIEASQIQDFDDNPVELTMVPVYAKPGFDVVLRDGPHFLEASSSNLGPDIFGVRAVRRWKGIRKDLAFESIDALVRGGEQTPITVRGVLDGNELDVYSVTTGDGTYGIMDEAKTESK